MIKYTPLIKKVNGDFLYLPVQVYKYEKYCLERAESWYTHSGPILNENRIFYDSKEECQEKCDELNRGN